jgi:hypothetical protein
MNISLKIKLLRVVTAGAVLALFVCSAARGQNLVQNPGFYPSGSEWTITPPTVTGDLYNMYSQTLPTVAGDSYSFSFDYNTIAGSGLDFLQVTWDGVALPYIDVEPTAQSSNYDTTEYADGSSSVISFEVNPGGLADILNVDVEDLGSDPPTSYPPYTAPDSGIGFGMVAALLLGLCAAERYQRFLSPRLLLHKVA